jgi:hypothetical protein
VATVRQRDTAAAGQQAVQAGHLATQAEGRTSTDAGGVGGRVVRRWLGWCGNAYQGAVHLRGSSTVLEVSVTLSWHK